MEMGKWVVREEWKIAFHFEEIPANPFSISMLSELGIAAEQVLLSASIPSSGPKLIR